MPLLRPLPCASRAHLLQTRGGSRAVLRILAGALAAFGVSAGVSNTVFAQPKTSTLAQPKQAAAPKRIVEGIFPVGWKVYSDTVLERSFVDTTSLVTKEVNGLPGWRLQSGPASIAWSPKNIAHGSYVLIGNTFLSPPASALLKPGYGIVFGGKNLGTPDATYTEFLIRNDAMYSVRQHIGKKVNIIKDWTVQAGISQHSGRRDEMAGNLFRIIVDERSVQIVVNRVVMYSGLRSALQTDGTFGVRVGTDQSLDVSMLQLDKLLPPDPPPAKKPESVKPLKPQPAKPPAAGVPTGQRRG